MTVPLAPVRVPSQKTLAPSVTSVANEKGDYEMILGVMHISPDICLTAEGIPGKPQLGDFFLRKKLRIIKKIKK